MARNNVLENEKNYWENQKEFNWLSEKNTKKVLESVPKPKGNVLELCIGSGMFTRQMDMSETSEYIGLDISSSLLKNLKKSIPGIKTVKGNAEKLNFKENYFDQVFVFGGLHHLPNIKSAIDSSYKVLKRKGTFICLEPNKDAWYRYVMHVLRKWRILNIYTEDELFLDPLEISAIIKKAGFKNIKIQYITPNYRLSHMHFLLPLFLAMKIASIIPGRLSQSFFIITCEK